MEIEELLVQIQDYSGEILEGVEMILEDFLDYSEIENLNFGKKSKSQFLKSTIELSYEDVGGEDYEILSVEVINLEYSITNELDKDLRDVPPFKLNAQPIEHDPKGGHYLLEAIFPIKANTKTIKKLKELDRWKNS